MSLVRTTVEVCPHDGSPAEVVRSLPAGTRIGDYTVVRVLGEGGMGTVYEVRHEVLRRRAAMKFLHPEMTQNEALVTRFLQEAKAVNVISHDNIIDIYDYGEEYGEGDGGVVYFVMEFLEGESFADLLERQGRLPLDLTVHIFTQIMRALSAAHKANIIHRDLKPENVFLARREADPHFVKLLDFGIARMRGEGAVEGLTRAGTLMGTPQFMSPEQATGRDIDARSDIFSLGVMLYRAVVGQVPFDGPTMQSLLVAVITEDPVPPRQAAPDARIPDTLERLIMRSLSKDPEQRYRSIDAMLIDLDAVKAEAGIQDQAITLADRGGPTVPDVGVRGDGAGRPVGAMAQHGTAGGALHAVAAPAGRRWLLPVALAAVAAAIAIGAIVMRADGDGGQAETGSQAATPATPANPANPTSNPTADGTRLAALVAAGKLSEARTEAHAQLEDALANGSPNTRRLAVEALARAATPRAAPLLYQALSGAPQDRVVAAEALRELALPEAAPKVRAALGRSGPKLAVPLAACLVALGDDDALSILEQALEGNAGDQLLAAEALATSGKADGDARAKIEKILSDALAGPAGRGRWYQGARGLLALDSDAARQALRAELSRKEPERAVAAAEILARAGDDDAVEMLARVVEDREHRARGEAALALARVGDARALAFAADVLAKPADGAGADEMDETDSSDPRAIAVAVAARLARTGGDAHAAAIAAIADESRESAAGLAARAALLAL